MATPSDFPKFVAVTRVKAGREQDFERLVPVIAAASEQVRPHLNGQWHLLRPDTDETSIGAAVYMFLFYGDVPPDVWELEPLLIEAHGEEEGQRLAQRFDDCVEGEQDVYAFSGEVAKS